MNLAETQIHRWSRDEYYRMYDMGLFEGQRVELIEGVIYEMGAMYSPHATAITKTMRVLFRCFGESVVIRPQLPLTLPGARASEPEPDLAVVAGSIDDYRAEHPDSALLIIEVAESSLEKDRTIKASLYARAGIADYWIVNLEDRQVEIHRDPVPDSERPSGFRYSTVTMHVAEESVSPLFAPQTTIAVSDLLP